MKKFPVFGTLRPKSETIVVGLLIRDSNSPNTDPARIEAKKRFTNCKNELRAIIAIIIIIQVINMKIQTMK
jgi:hypothetical protein